MFNNKCVLSVFVNGQFKPENGETVLLGFNSEYALRLRNKNDRRVVAVVSIDNEEQGRFIIAPCSYSDIERPAHSQAKFKFVSLDSDEACEFGKNGPNIDGTKGEVKVDWYFEKIPVYQYSYPQYPIYTGLLPWKPSVNPRRESWRYLNTTTSYNVKSVNDAVPMSSLGVSSNTVKAQDGCTVEGTSSSQSFLTSHIETEPFCYTTRLFLKGFDPLKEAQASIVKHIVETTKTPKAVESPGTNDKLRIEAEKFERKLLEARIAIAKIEYEKLAAQLESM